MSDAEETTEVEETPAETTEEPATELTLAEQHVAFKLKASEVLEEYASQRNWCDVFDDIIERVGLRGRPVVEEYTRRQATPEGEDTVEEFQEWRLRASKELHREATRYDVPRSQVDEVMARAGPATHAEVFRTVEAVIEGTFRITRKIELPVEDNLIDHVHVPSHIVQYWVRNEWDTPSVQWKVTVADESTNDPQEPSETAQR